tara:strand:+ start:328 stop:918 length:591 start_codon:yes stop_codon:yes gene_type:complete
MFYTVYQITNTNNGKIYIGCHKTDNIDDDYMGSGKLIKKAINKYGIELFTKKIIGTFESEDQMFDEEKNLISKLDPDYNIHPGGYGGWGHIKQNGMKGKPQTERQKAAVRKWLKENQHKMHKTTDARRKASSLKFLGKKHTDKTKRKIGEANSKHQKGSGNSQFGTMWITNGTNNKKIKKVDIIPEGWYNGRIMKV